MFGEQILQAFFVVIFISQLQHRPAKMQGEPHDRFANFRFVPRHRANAPRPTIARERRRRRFIEQNFRVRMILQKRGGNRGRHLAFDRTGDNLRLVFAEPQQNQLPCVENRADAHCQRMPRHVLFAKKIAGGVAASDFIERD